MSGGVKQSREWGSMVTALVVLDAISVAAALLLAGWLASRDLHRFVVQNYGSYILLVVPVFLVIFFTQGLYDRRNLLGGTREYAAAVRGCTYSLVGLVLLGYVVGQHIGRAWPLLSWALAVVFIGVERFVVRHIVYRFRRRGLFTTRTLVVGADADSVALASQLADKGSGVKVVGFLDDYLPIGSVVGDGLKVLGRPRGLVKTAARIHATEAIIFPQALPWETVQGLMTEAAAAPDGLQVHLSAGFYELLITNVRLSERNRVPLLTVTRASLTPFETAFKATLDYGLATILLVAFAPVIAWTAMRLKLRGTGSVIARRPVLGRNGQRFEQLSFGGDGQVRRDFVRKLPALVNVLSGQLSLVGPRPIGASEAPATARRARLQTIRPGLTGPWRQVEDIEEQALLDLYYIRSYSIWLDLQVLFTRLRARLRRKQHQSKGINARTLQRSAR